MYMWLIWTTIVYKCTADGEFLRKFGTKGEELRTLKD
jgi:hypothetical protein